MTTSRTAGGTRRRPGQDPRGGFTLVELIVVVLLGIVILAGLFRVLISTQQVYTTQNARMMSQQSVRAGMAVLFGELREVSPAGGDIVLMEANRLTVRAMRTTGVACDVDASGTPQLTVTQIGRWFQDQDSVFVFAENNPNSVADDQWLAARISTVDTTAMCDTRPAQILSLPAMGAAFTANQVQEGAPVRSFQHITYEMVQLDGTWYLAQRRPGSSPEPLVGPLLAPQTGAPLFRYLNWGGNPTAVPAQVRQVEVTLRSDSRVRGPDGDFIRDSLSTRIQTRN